jgi:hypothetical protein
MGVWGLRPNGVQGQSPLKLVIFFISTSMISVKIYCMKSTIKLQSAATEKLKIAFVELCKCEIAQLLYTCTIHQRQLETSLIRGVRGEAPLKLVIFCILTSMISA